VPGDSRRAADRAELCLPARIAAPVAAHLDEAGKHPQFIPDQEDSFPQWRSPLSGAGRFKIKGAEGA
jgi:hypothetical protein